MSIQTPSPSPSQAGFMKAIWTHWSGWNDCTVAAGRDQDEFERVA